MKAHVVGAWLTVLGCAGILVIAYLLCAEKVGPAADELFSGTPNLLGLAILASLLADVGGALLLAWSTREARPAWVALVLVMAVLIPVSITLWFGILCRLVG